jgi:hypothetical protein
LASPSLPYFASRQWFKWGADYIVEEKFWSRLAMDDAIPRHKPHVSTRIETVVLTRSLTRSGSGPEQPANRAAARQRRFLSAPIVFQQALTRRF